MIRVPRLPQSPCESELSIIGSFVVASDSAETAIAGTEWLIDGREVFDYIKSRKLNKRK